MIQKMRTFFFVFIGLSFVVMYGDYQFRLKNKVVKKNIPTLNQIPVAAEKVKNTDVQDGLQIEKVLRQPKNLNEVSKNLKNDDIEYLKNELLAEGSSLERKAISIELLSKNGSSLSKKSLQSYVNDSSALSDDSQHVLRLQALEALEESTESLE